MLIGGRVPKRPPCTWRTPPSVALAATASPEFWWPPGGPQAPFCLGDSAPRAWPAIVRLDTPRRGPGPPLTRAAQAVLPAGAPATPHDRPPHRPAWRAWGVDQTPPTLSPGPACASLLLCCTPGPAIPVCHASCTYPPPAPTRRAPLQPPLGPLRGRECGRRSWAPLRWEPRRQLASESMQYCTVLCSG